VVGRREFYCSATLRLRVFAFGLLKLCQRWRASTSAFLINTPLQRGYGTRESKSTVLTVSYRAQSKRRGKSARLCRRFPTCCIADFQSAARGHFGRYGIDASPADWKSATQQTGSLRHARARTCERLANSARSWSAVVLYRFAWARGFGVRQPLLNKDASALPKRQRTGALHDADESPGGVGEGE